VENAVIILDGGFVKLKLRETLKRFATADDVEQLCLGIMAHPRLAGFRLFRAFFYDAEPFEGSATNPLNKRTTNFSVTNTAIRGRALLKALELPAP